MLTRKHFTLLAQINRDALASAHDSDSAMSAGRFDGVAAVAMAQVTAFKEDNPRFDAYVYLTACGFEDYQIQKLRARADAPASDDTEGPAEKAYFDSVEMRLLDRAPREAAEARLRYHDEEDTLDLY